MVCAMSPACSQHEMGYWVSLLGWMHSLIPVKQDHSCWWHSGADSADKTTFCKDTMQRNHNLNDVCCAVHVTAVPLCIATWTVALMAYVFSVCRLCGGPGEQTRFILSARSPAQPGFPYGKSLHIPAVSNSARVQQLFAQRFMWIQIVGGNAANSNSYHHCVQIFNHCMI